MSRPEVTLQEGVNTLELSNYSGVGLSAIFVFNADGSTYDNEDSPGVVQYGDSTHEYQAEWVSGGGAQFFMEGQQSILVSGSAYVNAVIFGKTYQVRFE